MGFLDYIRPVETWSAARVQDFLDRHSPEEYNLLDVCCPAEYAQRHLPGARSLPLDQLRERSGELDPALPTIVYCSSGVRSRAAAAVL